MELSGGGAVRLERIVSAHRQSPKLFEKLDESLGFRVIANLRITNPDREILVPMYALNKHLATIECGTIPFLTAKRWQRTDGFVH